MPRRIIYCDYFINIRTISFYFILISTPYAPLRVTLFGNGFQIIRLFLLLKHYLN